MPHPFRMNPVTIKVKKLDSDSTAFDDDFDEPVGPAAQDAEVSLSGQVNLGPGRTYEDLMRVRSGDAERTYGTLVFRKTDLDAVPFTFNKGDKIIEIAGFSVNYEVTQVKPTAPLDGAFLLIEVTFEEDTQLRKQT